MSLIKPKSVAKRKQVRINILESIAEEAEAYCKWAGLNKLDDFFEQAAQLVFSKDKDWKNQKKNS